MRGKWILIALLAAPTAWAQPQTSFCGSDISDLSHAIRSYNNGAGSSDRHSTPATWLVGTWKRVEQVFFHDVILPIHRAEAFNIAQRPVNVCPQAANSFYVYNRNNPGQYATVSFMSKGELVLSDVAGDNMLAQAVGPYLKVSN